MVVNKYGCTIHTKNISKLMIEVYKSGCVGAYGANNEWNIHW